MSRVRELNDEIWAARRDGRPDLGVHLAREMLELARAGSDSMDLIIALKAAGQVHRDFGAHAEALDLHHQAIEVCRGSGESALLAHTLRHVGDMHLDRNELTQAEPYLYEALAIARGIPNLDQLELANTLRPLAIVNERLGQLEMARALWTEARDRYGAVGLQEGVDECSAHLSALS